MADGSLERAETLRNRLARAPILTVPGVYDPLTASLAEAAGFEAVYLSGAAVSYTRLGRPDIGLTTASEMAETLALIRDRIRLPIVIDADTGFGNAVNAQRTLRLFERAGAGALQMEDQTFPKRCGHLKGKSLIPTAEMAGKIAAMADARHSRETLIIARTDAIAVEGFDAALERGEAYLEAGADILFIEAPRSADQMRTITDRFSSRIPLMANMVEGGDTPLAGSEQLQAMGFAMVIFPGGIVRAVAKTAQAYYRSLQATGSNAAFSDSMFDFKELNELLGTKSLLTDAARWDPES